MLGFIIISGVGGLFYYVLISLKYKSLFLLDESRVIKAILLKNVEFWLI